MKRLPIPEPVSAGLLLSYKCSGSCKHCMYACSPSWSADWISEEDAERVLVQLAIRIRGQYPSGGRIGVNEGLHFTGGEPFLNFDLLLRLTEIATRLEIPATFVETNGFWCRDDETTRRKLLALRQAGLHGILVSANPFLLEAVPFERTERAGRVGHEVFGGNTMIYQRFFYDQFKALGLAGRLPFEQFLQTGTHGLQGMELFANGRVPYKLAALFRLYPARRFFGASCRRELIRGWHVHVDNYCNYVPGYCGGLSLGDARDLDAICRGIDLEERPVLGALVTDLGELYQLANQYGYEEEEGYISKCHLCLDVRRHLARNGEFLELQPRAFYEHLED